MFVAGARFVGGDFGGNALDSWRANARSWRPFARQVDV